MTQALNDVDADEFLTPQQIPTSDMTSVTPETGTRGMLLNPKGFAESGGPPAELPATWNEEAGQQPGPGSRTKPTAQYEYAFKLGMGFAAKGISNETLLKILSTRVQHWNYPMPFVMTDNDEEWTEAFIRYYAYCLHVVDEHIARVLDALDSFELSNNTIILFAPDHGEYGGSHMMMSQKWHSAYQEMLHVPMVVSSPLVNDSSDTPRDCNALTSHIDILPTIVGFSGDTPDMGAAPTPAGVNLAPHILDKNDDFGSIRSDQDDGVLFVMDDEITKPLYESVDGGALDSDEASETANESFRVFKRLVKHWTEQYGLDDAGPIAQPACVECYCTNDWKLVRYVDRAGGSSLQHFELYHRATDPTEANNCLQYDDFGTVVHAPSSMNEEEVRTAADDLLARLKIELAAIERKQQPLANS